MTCRQRLLEHALAHHGVITTRDAAQLEIPAVEVRKLAARGFLQRLGYGTYRVPVVPPTNFTQYAETLALVGAHAHLVGDAVLALHDLCLVNPRRIRVATPRRNRVTVPRWVEVQRGTWPDDDLTTYEGLATTTVARALIDCRAVVMTERLYAGLDEAIGQGLVSAREVARVVEALGPRPAASPY